MSLQWTPSNATTRCRHRRHAVHRRRQRLRSLGDRRQRVSWHGVAGHRISVRHPLPRPSASTRTVAPMSTRRRTSARVTDATGHDSPTGQMLDLLDCNVSGLRVCVVAASKHGRGLLGCLSTSCTSTAESCDTSADDALCSFGGLLVSPAASIGDRVNREPRRLRQSRQQR